MNLPPDPEKMNDERAGWADDCIAHFMSTTGCDREDALSDLLCSLMHWCDRNGKVFGNELDRGSDHYIDETRASTRETSDAEGASYV
jgi:hypothetical protein